MRGGNVAERLALVNHVVPREREAAALRPVFQKKIRHHPRAVLKFLDARRDVFAIRANQIPSQEMRCSKDHTVCMKADGRLAFVVQGDHIDAGAPISLERNDL